MFDGLVAFAVCAILVWFVLGMVQPVLSLPPMIMRLLEAPGVVATRKMVVQWSSIFIVGLFALILISDALIKNTRAASSAAYLEVSSLLSVVKVETQLLIDSEVLAVDISSGCQSIAIADMKNIELIMKQINFVEFRIEADKKTHQRLGDSVSALKDIRLRVKAMRATLKLNACIP